MYVDYDDYAYRQMDKHNNSKLTGLSEVPEQGDILETRLGVCKDVAKLYTTMLAKADIKSRMISGCIGPKNVNMRQCENPHAWTVVWLNNKWEFYIAKKFPEEQCLVYCKNNKLLGKIFCFLIFS